MSYYRGYDYDDDYDFGYGGGYRSRFESDFRDRDRFGGWSEREDRRSGGGRRDRDIGFGGRRDRDIGYGGRDSGYGGRKGGGGKGSWGGGGGGGGDRRGGKGDGNFRGGRSRSGGRENGGRSGGKRPFGGKSKGPPAKKGRPDPKATDNWVKTDRHSVMQSHFMDTVPDYLPEDWLCYVCPAGKRCLVVAANNITQTYNNAGTPDMKFKSCLPNGSPEQSDVLKYHDLTILDAVFCPQKKQFYIIDMMHWKHFPYYDTEAEFRFFFLPGKFSQLKNPTVVSENNQYPMVVLEKFACTESSIEQALRDTKYKVEGLVFINKKSTYECSDSDNSLLLRVDQMERVLGIPVPTEITYVQTGIEDTKWRQELEERKKLKAAREAATEKEAKEKEAKQKETAVSAGENASESTNDGNYATENAGGDYSTEGDYSTGTEYATEGNFTEGWGEAQGGEAAEFYD